MLNKFVILIFKVKKKAIFPITEIYIYFILKIKMMGFTIKILENMTFFFFLGCIELTIIFK